MDLLDRYLQAVRFWLPKTQSDDIVAELSEDIRSNIEEKEAELGRKLKEAEVGTILKGRGRPVLVANRYLPQEHLIGPIFFPIYRFVLKIVAVCYLVPWILVWFGFMIFDPVYRASHTGVSWIKTLGVFWADFWIVAVIAVGGVTIIFAVVERVQAKSGFLENWDPQKLPAVRDPNRIARSASIVELVASMVFCAWWIAAVRSPVIMDHPGVRITLAPVWPYFFWSYLLLLLTSMPVSAVNLLRPYWTRWRAGLRLLTDGGGLALLGILCKSNILAEISIAGVSPARALEITKAINLWMSRALPAVVGAGLVILAFDIYRITRVKPISPRLTTGMASGRLPTPGG